MDEPFMTNPSGGSDENDRTTALVDDGKAKRGTYASALSSTLKTIVGTGVIALPYAMLEAGWLFGTIILLIVAYLSAYSMKVLIHCSHEVRFRYGSRVIRDEEIGEDEKEDDGDGSIRRIAKYTYGSWGVVVSDIILVTSQVGSAIAFAEFIITSWSDVLGVHVIWPAIVVAPILIFLSLLKSTASLDHFATIGNLIFLVSFTCLFVFGFGTTKGTFQHMETTSKRSSDLSSALGLSLFALAAQSECMSIERFLPKKIRKQYDGILNISVVIATALYISIALLCYAFFGEKTKDVIFDNIRCDDDDGGIECGIFSRDNVNAMRGVVKLGMASMIVSNFPFTLEGASHTVEEWLLGRSAKPWMGILVEPIAAVSRTIIVIGTIIVALVTQDFGFLLSLVGTFTGGLLAFVVPPAFYLRLHLNVLKKERRYAEVARHVAILVLGLMFSIAATIVLILNKAS